MNITDLLAIRAAAGTDARTALKELLRSRFEDNKNDIGKIALEQHEADPATWKEPLKKSLGQIRAEHDEDIRNALELLVKSLEHTPEWKQIAAKYQADVKDSHIGVLGDHARVDEIHHGNRHSLHGKNIQGANLAEQINTVNQYFQNDKDDDPGKRMRAAYLSHLLCDAGFLSLEGVDPGAASCDGDSRLNLGAVYTALLTRNGDEQEYIARMGMGQARQLSALEVVNRHPHVVLLGDPGSGKTTFVNFVCLCLAGEALGHPEASLGLLTRPVPEDKDEDDEKEPQPWDHGALLPVRVILRDFAARGMSDQEADLWGFIKGELEKAELADFAPLMKQELLEKGGLLLLDGLDEVPEADNRRVLIRKVVENFIGTFHQCRVLVTSRTYAYQQQDWRIPGLHETILAPFTGGQIRQFVTRWYEHVAELKRSSPEDAQGKAELLKRAIFANDRIGELAERPLLLTLIASLHSWRGGSLPERREELYADTADLLLDWWERPKIVRDAGGNPVMTQPSLMEWLKTDRAKIRRMLNELAYNAHAGQPELTGTADISEDDLVRGLWDLSNNPDVNPVKLMRYLSNRAGVLIPRGVKVYSFPHRTFQEYLAACHLTDTDYPDHVAELCRKEPNRWREVCLLAGAKAARGGEFAVWSLADALCHREPDDPKAGAADVWGAHIAGQALAETADLDKISPRNEKKLDRVRRWLLHLMEGDHLPAAERALAGNHLAVLGDPRFNPDLWYLPQRGFVKIPAGKFIMGTKEEDAERLLAELSKMVNESNESDFKIITGLIKSECPQHEVELSEYAISRYPVTVAQFRTFVQDSGYEPEEDWEKDNEYDNHPVVNISWHDAIAYCKWLTEKLKDRGWKIQLPTEAQWEKAARGTDARIYPWGDEADPEKANYDDTGIGTTSAVGCFSRGAGIYGIQDMSGNVWEWCLDRCDLDENYRIITDTYKDGLTDPVCTTGSSRVFRGGSWGSNTGCRLTYRGYYSPGYRYGDYGFRLALIPSQQ
ncbi:SUMF1/EgtB/PvdO family nonheme iron enzyme [Desulfococcaceae bacterium HSG8]|nr:SUMF1/EgtB/PvdO family nonheme iron enzyme [Desulfococcaceae bacterium HSG8]